MNETAGPSLFGWLSNTSLEHTTDVTLTLHGAESLQGNQVWAPGDSVIRLNRCVFIHAMKICAVSVLLNITETEIYERVLGPS